MANIRAEEFVNKVLTGERDFSYVHLRDFDANLEQFDTFVMLNEYLKKQDLKENPIILTGADLTNIKAGGLWFPYVKAGGATFREVYLVLGNLKYGEFPRASFYRTNLDQANCQYCDFYNAYFKEASLHSTHLGKAQFKFANLSGVSQLAYALELAHAHFENTYVNEEEKKIILEAIKQNPDYWDFDAGKIFRQAPTQSPK